MDEGMGDDSEPGTMTNDDGDEHVAVSFPFDRMTVQRFRQEFPAPVGAIGAKLGSSLERQPCGASTAGKRRKNPAPIRLQRRREGTPSPSSRSSAHI